MTEIGEKQRELQAIARSQNLYLVLPSVCQGSRTRNGAMGLQTSTSIWDIGPAGDSLTHCAPGAMILEILFLHSPKMTSDLFPNTACFCMYRVGAGVGVCMWQGWGENS